MLHPQLQLSSIGTKYTRKNPTPRILYGLKNENLHINTSINSGISSLIKVFLLVSFCENQHFKFSNYYSSLPVMMQLMLVPTNFLISTPLSRIMLTLLLLVLKKQGRGFWRVVSVLGSSLGEVWCC